MASKRKAKRKPPHSRAGEWLALWIASFVGALVTGVIASPLTQLTSVRVSGAARHDQARIEASLQPISKTPALLVDVGGLKRRLLSPATMSVSMRRNVFGRARLTFVYRDPVAIMPDGLAVDESGNVFAIGKRLAPNLQISRKVEDFNTILTISDPSILRRLARLAKKLQVSMPKLAGTLEFDDTEGLSLDTDGLVVEFGDTSRLDRKVQVLADLFREDPQRAAKGGRIVLVDPDNAVQRR
jgi:cell division septal protein FtsQ